MHGFTHTYIGEMSTSLHAMIVKKGYLMKIFLTGLFDLKERNDNNNNNNNNNNNK
jgi:hypothetical protein